MPSGLLALGSQPVTAPVVAFTLNSLCRVARAPLQLKPPPVPWVPLPVRQTLSWWPTFRFECSMSTHTHYLWFETKKRQEIIDITEQVAEQVRASGVREGMVLVSAMHISASVFVNDHESGLWHDIIQWLEGTIAPWDPTRYRHNETGEDNAAAHLRSLTVGHEVIVPITGGKLDFGPWQRVFYGEWDGQRRKRVIIKVMGEQ